ncbi:hypothetical protein JCM19235_2478 [Vibrio maritimus]|uniref:Uncharacterized protein n=1 Tax=Vibrio maritimus TaxID=990268 RepID=A0A090RUF8_9VIBR|nr:hypothetical protein JCM19235_2478 [Vibrio maritimus]
MLNIVDVIEKDEFQGALELNYAMYRNSYKQNYEQLTDIKLVGDSREVRIMNKWIAKHFPDIVLSSELSDEECDGYNRSTIEAEGEERLSTFDKFRYDEFWRISSSLSSVADFHNLFDVDHAKSIREHGIEAIHPDNLNIMLFRANRKKSFKSQERYSWERQEEVIWASLRAVTELSTDEERVVRALVGQLKALY